VTEPPEPDETPAPPPTPVDDDPLALARDVANSYRGKGTPMPAPGRKRRVRPAKPYRADRDQPSPLGELLGEVVRDQGWDDQLAAQRVFTDWAAIVGPEVAQHSEVVAYADGEVEVKASSTAWATELRFLASRIVAKLNAELGDGSVLRIVVLGPQGPSWKNGPRSIRGARGPRDTYG
jgi:predicted nucleic acid-binding Zn ribbon protein